MSNFINKVRSLLGSAPAAPAADKYLAQAEALRDAQHKLKAEHLAKAEADKASALAEFKAVQKLSAVQAEALKAKAEAEEAEAARVKMLALKLEARQKAEEQSQDMHATFMEAMGMGKAKPKAPVGADPTITQLENWLTWEEPEVEVEVEEVEEEEEPAPNPQPIPTPTPQPSGATLDDLLAVLTRLYQQGGLTDSIILATVSRLGLNLDEAMIDAINAHIASLPPAAPTPPSTPTPAPKRIAKALRKPTPPAAPVPPQVLTPAPASRLTAALEKLTELAKAGKLSSGALRGVMTPFAPLSEAECAEANAHVKALGGLSKPQEQEEPTTPKPLPIPTPKAEEFQWEEAEEFSWE